MNYEKMLSSSILSEKLKMDTMDCFEKYKPTQKQAEKIIKKIEETYIKMSYEAGEAVGVVAAQSISEPATQMTMRTYHTAGSVVKQVSLGLPRLIEILDARKEATTPIMQIYLDPEHNNREDATKIAKRIKETKMKNIVLEDVIDLVNLAIEIKLDTSYLKDLQMNKEELIKLFNKQIRGYDIKIEGNRIELKSKKEEVTIRDLQKIKLKIFDMRLRGVSGIEQAMVTKEGEEWVITTIGSNLRKVIKIEGIDPKRLFSNNIKEVEKLFGIEAARNAIIKEACGTLADQGLTIDPRHIILVGDMMTIDGEIKAIGRYGVAGSKRSVLARANFETTVKHLTEAAVNGNVDNLDSIIENVLINQVAPVGTNICDIVFKPKKSKK
ncbi:MAG: DNA-directed RNA polymerase subunit A'' [archaeon]|nr:MAG: DNA-directed RNA polymerase subunit A'' [archaeon]